MNRVTPNQHFFNHEVKDDLATIDLIDHMLVRYQKQATECAQIAQWYALQAEALIAERRALAADVTEVLRQAEGLLR